MSEGTARGSAEGAAGSKEGSTDGGTVDSAAASSGAAGSSTPDGVPTDDTPATRALAQSGVEHRVVRSQPAGSAEEAAQLQGIPLGALLRTIVVRRGDDDYLFVLIPAGRRFDWPKLRKHLGVTRLSLPDADEAQAVTGYVRYTITPFGSIRAWPVLVDASVIGEPVVSVGGGARGVNVHLAPSTLIASLDAEVADLTVVDAT